MEIKMFKETPEDVERYHKMFRHLCSAIPQDIDLRTVMRAAEFLLASCIVQLDIPDKVESVFYKTMMNDIKSFAKEHEDNVKKLRYN